MNFKSTSSVFFISFILSIFSLLFVSAAPPSATSLRQEQVDLRANKVYGDVVDVFMPTATLSLTYGKSDVMMGDQVTPAVAKKAPTLNVKGLKAGQKYTVVMTDPGVLSTMEVKPMLVKVNENNLGDGGNNRYLRKLAEQLELDQDAWQWLHWIVQDIEVKEDMDMLDEEPTLDFTNAYTVTEYSGPNPPEGNHRYVVLLMEQQEFNGYRANQGTEVITERGAFSTRKYINEHQVDVVGVMVYYSEN